MLVAMALPGCSRVTGSGRRLPPGYARMCGKLTAVVGLSLSPSAVATMAARPCQFGAFPLPVPPGAAPGRRDDPPWPSVHRTWWRYPAPRGHDRLRHGRPPLHSFLNVKGWMMRRDGQNASSGFSATRMVPIGLPTPTIDVTGPIFAAGTLRKLPPASLIGTAPPARTANSGQNPIGTY